jgi:predicted alpha/beta superfamily hydrolase
MRAVYILLVLSVLTGEVPALGAPALGAKRPITLGYTYELPSAIMGQARKVNVLLPDEYDDPAKAAKRYPVLYLLDGGTGWQDFAHIASMVQQGGRWGANAAMMVVGIESKDRRAEFTEPSNDPKEQKDYPTHGRSDRFRKFLAEEVKPAIADRCRTSGDAGTEPASDVASSPSADIRRAS